MKKLFKIILIISLLMVKEVSATTDITFDDGSPIIKIYDSSFIDGDLGGMNRYYLKNDLALTFKVLASGRKVSRIRKGKEIIMEDKKPAMININITKSDNITCVINNVGNIYSLNGNTFTLANQTVDLMETIIGTISCSLPSTEEAIILSSDNFLSIEIISHDRNYVDGSTADEMMAYRFHLGVINLTYLNSLNNSEEITSISFDDKVPEGDKLELKTGTTKMHINRDTPSSKVMITLTSGDEEKINKELTTNEEILPLAYGINKLKVKEITAKSAFVSTLGSDYEVSGLSKSDLNANNYEHTYTLNRLDMRSKVNTLKSLEISDTKLVFKPDIKKYTTSVPYKVSSVIIKTTLTDSKSTYLPNFGNREITLDEGLNTILIKVKAENGDVNTYTINITREKNNDATLSKLVVNGKEVRLKEDLLTYSIILDNDIETPDIKATTKDSKAQVTISEINTLSLGSNKVTITVKADAGNELVYNLDIIRDNQISMNANLKSIFIKNHGLDFTPDCHNYQIKLNNNERKLSLTIVPENEKATYKITGNHRLKNKSVVIVEVTAEDNQYKSLYTINIIKESNLIKIIFVAILFVSIIFLVIKSKKHLFKK